MHLQESALSLTFLVKSKILGGECRADPVNTIKILSHFRGALSYSSAEYSAVQATEVLPRIARASAAGMLVTLGFILKNDHAGPHDMADEVTAVVRRLRHRKVIPQGHLKEKLLSNHG